MAKKGLINKIRRLWGKIPLLTEAVLGIAAILFLTIGVMLFWFATTPIPNINDFETRRVPESTKIYDRTGTTLLYDVHGSIRRTTVPLEEISPYIQKATIAIEDPDFYSHAGISLRAILRAIVADILTLDFGQGGSTITQQVVKNTILSTEKTITRKVKEWTLAIKLERTYNKDQILGVYLNENPYGGTIYGVEEASQYFFGKAAKDVGLAEAAYLAALPQAPTYYSPNGNHRDALESRKNLVLQKMKEVNFITEEEHVVAREEKVVFLEENEQGIKAPHFVFFIREYLEQKYGADVVYREGLKVVTTLDYDLQKQAEEIVKTYALENEARASAENAGLVAIDPNTGQILTMVGSRDYFDETIDGKYNIAIADRQPGSSFKPFVYATAFEKGYTPDTSLFNVRTQFSTACAPNFLETTDTCYSPDNYDHTFTGPMTLREALAQSVNIPAVKLLYLVGIDSALATAERMGITTLTTAARYGLTLVLGGGEVHLLDMVSAYGGFATDGMRHPATGILKVQDMRAKILEEYVDQSTRVLDEQTARQVSDVLSDNNARIPAYGASSPLHFPGFDVAVKTGTTNDSRDAWIVGYTPGLVAGAWAGNNDNTPMVKQTAGFIIAPMWHEFMVFAMEKYPAGSFIPPTPTDQSLPAILRGVWNIPGSDGLVHSILYWIDKNNPLLGNPPSNPYADQQYQYWETGISLWGGGATSTSPNIPGTTPFSITTPTNGTSIAHQTPISVQVSPQPRNTITNVSYYFNGAFIGNVSTAPFSIVFVPTSIGTGRIEAIAQGSFGSGSQTVTFTVR